MSFSLPRSSNLRSADPPPSPTPPWSARKEGKSRSRGQGSETQALFKEPPKELCNAGRSKAPTTCHGSVQRDPRPTSKTKTTNPSYSDASPHPTPTGYSDGVNVGEARQAKEDSQATIHEVERERGKVLRGVWDIVKHR
jgi:hypothetical protein